MSVCMKYYISLQNKIKKDNALQYDYDINFVDMEVKKRGEI